ncbi:hypothetical protein ACMHYB_50140 [Sorangium sp. So ce1128]
MRRLCYAFSKKADHDAAAVALNYVAYNLTRVVRTLRVTPAMQAGITDHVWTLDDLLETLLAEAEGPAPEAKPLTHREPSAPARALPNNRGFLRLVTEPTPALKQRCRSEPPPPPAGPPVQVVPPPPPEPPPQPGPVVPVRSPEGIVSDALRFLRVLYFERECCTSGQSAAPPSGQPPV